MNEAALSFSEDRLGQPYWPIQSAIAFIATGSIEAARAARHAHLKRLIEIVGAGDGANPLQAICIAWGAIKDQCAKGNILSDATRHTARGQPFPQVLIPNRAWAEAPETPEWDSGHIVLRTRRAAYRKIRLALLHLAEDQPNEDKDQSKEDWRPIPGSGILGVWPEKSALRKPKGGGRPNADQVSQDLWWRLYREGKIVFATQGEAAAAVKALFEEMYPNEKAPQKRTVARHIRLLQARYCFRTGQSVQGRPKKGQRRSRKSPS